MLARVWRKENPPSLLVGIDIGTTIWGVVWRFLKNLKIQLPCDPTAPLLGISLEKTTIQCPRCSLLGQPHPAQAAPDSGVTRRWSRVKESRDSRVTKEFAQHFPRTSSSQASSASSTLLDLKTQKKLIRCSPNQIVTAIEFYKISLL